MSYRPPQITIQQEFATIPTAVVEDLQAVVVGPNKRVFEYDNVTDKAVIDQGAYDYTQDTDYSWLGLPTGAVVELDSATLVFEELWARYATIANTVAARGDAANIVKIDTLAFVESDASARNTAFKNRDVKVGDRVKVTGGASPLETRIIALRDTPVPASASAFTNGSGNFATLASANTITSVGTAVGTHTATSSSAAYVGDMEAGYIEDTYTVTVLAPGALGTGTFIVTSEEGDNVATVTSGLTTVAIAIGTKGLTMTITGTGPLEAGQSYTIDARAAYTRVTPEITGSSGADYAGAIDTTYTVKVVRGGDWDTGTIQVSASTNNGVDYMPPTTISAPGALGENLSFALGTLGVWMKFPANVTQDGLVTGETYLVSLTAAAEGAINEIVLADVLDDTVAEDEGVTLELFIYKASFEIPIAGYPDSGDIALVAEEDTVTVSAGINITDSTWVDDAGEVINMPVIKANVFTPYSSLLVVGTEVFSTISEISAIEAVLGKTIPTNPLAYGVLKALENSNGQPVNYVAIATDDYAGYESALGTLEKHGKAYFGLPLSHDLSVVNLYKAHVLAMSDGVHGLERIELISQPLSTTVVKYGLKSTGGYWLGYVALSGGKYKDVRIPGADFLTDGVRAGDSVRVDFGVDNFGNETYTTATVGSVVDAQSLFLSGNGLASAYASSGSPLRIDIIRNLTKTEQAESIAAVSSSFDSRRVYRVWPDFATDDAGNYVPGYFLACSVAGLKSSVVPHQGVTNYTLNGWSSVARSSSYFTPTQLDIIAAGGTLIVAQDEVGGPIYIRHQLSTDMSDANHAQLSVTTNFDSITKFCRNGLKNFIGKYNATPAFERIAHTMLVQMLSFLQTNTITETAGGQILDFDPNKIVVKQDPLVKTTVNARADGLGMPYPVDNFDLVLATA